MCIPSTCIASHKTQDHYPSWFPMLLWQMLNNVPLVCGVQQSITAASCVECGRKTRRFFAGVPLSIVRAAEAVLLTAARHSSVKTIQSACLETSLGKSNSSSRWRLKKKQLVVASAIDESQNPFRCTAHHLAATSAKSCIVLFLADHFSR